MFTVKKIYNRFERHIRQLFKSSGLRTIVYVDGFNLYYGALRKPEHKWLDINKLCEKLLAKNKIEHIKYFTADVKSLPNDPNKPLRQALYLRALGTLSNVSIIKGFYSKQKKSRLLVNPTANQKRALVWNFEEKGTDVNLASHLVFDGFRKKYDMAVVVSNDTDLLEPIRIVEEELNIPVGVISPFTTNIWGYANHGKHTFFKEIRSKKLLESCQFPNNLTDSKGTFTKPPEWK